MYFKQLQNKKYGQFCWMINLVKLGRDILYTCKLGGGGNFRVAVFEFG